MTVVTVLTPPIYGSGAIGLHGSSVGEDVSVGLMLYVPQRLAGASVGASTSIANLRMATDAGIIAEPDGAIPTTLGDELFAGLWPIREERWVSV